MLIVVGPRAEGRGQLTQRTRHPKRHPRTRTHAHARAHMCGVLFVPAVCGVAQERDERDTARLVKERLYTNARYILLPHVYVYIR